MIATKEEDVSAELRFEKHLEKFGVLLVSHYWFKGWMDWWINASKTIETSFDRSIDLSLDRSSFKL